MTPRPDNQTMAGSAAIPGEVAREESSVVASAAAAARAAQSTWARTTLSTRLKCMRRVRALIAEHGQELAAASAQQRQRPLLESLVSEVIPLAEACRFLEREAPQVLASRKLSRRDRPIWLSGVASEVRREPWGVVLIIGPGNYPLLLPGVQALQALVAGNAVLVKPGVGGSAPMFALRRLVELAGIDVRLFGVLPESTAAAQMAIATRPDKLLFTGSAVVGEKVLAQLAPQLIPATVELSGCDAFIVRADADLDLVVKALGFVLQLNAGATCLAPRRVLVSSARATELEGRLATMLPASLRAVGIPTHVVDLIAEALSLGAHFIAGGLDAEQRLQCPAVLGGVSPHARILREDIFLPLLSLVTVADDHEAVLRANDCPYALGATIFSRDESAARTLAARINAGVVTINDVVLPTADARLPFGGRNRSGYGSTRGAEGLLELSRPKVVTVTRTNFRPAFDAPRPGDSELFDSYLQLTHRSGFRARLKGFTSLVRSLTARSRRTLS